MFDTVQSVDKFVPIRGTSKSVCGNLGKIATNVQKSSTSIVSQLSQRNFGIKSSVLTTLKLILVCPFQHIALPILPN
jgi:hypothetical protein